VVETEENSEKWLRMTCGIEMTKNESTATEVAHQSSAMTSKNVSLLPEEMGELFGALHFLSTAEVISSLISGQDVKKVSTKGLLLDKPCGA
jgi:hypothetical protein